ncbi:hypothetical protein [Micrococcus luteus]|uniref:hypothetical protein n=1 Tax=Micrococcus luteus TaxID=1270 RepID=UPI0036805F7F
MTLQLDPYHDPKIETLDQYLDRLYANFRADLIEAGRIWPVNGEPLSFRRHDEVDGRHQAFWHCVSEQSNGAMDRVVEPERCIRLAWIGQLLDDFTAHYPNQGVLTCWWHSPRPGEANRVVIATRDFAYVVFVDTRPTYGLFVSAYPVNRSGRKKSFEKSYKQAMGLP